MTYRHRSELIQRVGLGEAARKELLASGMVENAINEAVAEAMGYQHPGTHARLVTDTDGVPKLVREPDANARKDSCGGQ